MARKRGAQNNGVEETPNKRPKRRGRPRKVVEENEGETENNEGEKVTSDMEKETIDLKLCSDNPKGGRPPKALKKRVPTKKVKKISQSATPQKRRLECCEALQIMVLI